VDRDLIHIILDKLTKKNRDLIHTFFKMGYHDLECMTGRTVLPENRSERKILSMVQESSAGVFKIENGLNIKRMTRIDMRTEKNK
jgi:hypothetical protein